MIGYANVLMIAFACFPLIASVITLPYILYNYHKHGSVLSLRILIIYSFVLYLLCIYLLVILPLPTITHVAHMTGPTMQLEPFRFVQDIAEGLHSMSGNWLSNLIHNKAAYQAVFNVLMTVPFGIYLRYYFRCSAAKTIFLSFGLSLFFELTQLSGLYFLYPRGYRLFDVDDLMTNTLGGAIGYLLAGPLMKILPSRRELDRASKLRSREVSWLRRLIGVGCDCVFLCILLLAISEVLRVAGIRSSFNLECSGLTLVVYYAATATLTGGCTFGGWVTRTAVRSIHGGRAKRWRIIWRYLIAGVLFVGLPYLYELTIDYLINVQNISNSELVVISIVFWGVYCFGLLIGLIRLIMHRPLLFERLSGTRLSSTIALNPRDRVDEKTEQAIDDSRIS